MCDNKTRNYIYELKVKPDSQALDEWPVFAFRLKNKQTSGKAFKNHKVTRYILINVSTVAQRM